MKPRNVGAKKPRSLPKARNLLYFYIDSLRVRAMESSQGEAAVNEFSLMNELCCLGDAALQSVGLSEQGLHSHAARVQPTDQATRQRKLERCRGKRDGRYGNGQEVKEVEGKTGRQVRGLGVEHAQESIGHRHGKHSNLTADMPGLASIAYTSDMPGLASTDCRHARAGQH